MVSVIIPTYNAGSFIKPLIRKLCEQTLAHELIIIDSGSTDDTVEIISNQENVSLIKIQKNEFNHGTTRNLGLRLAKSNVVIFLTQDALPVTSNTLETLVAALHSNDNIAMAYGRQLPNPNSSVFGRLARLINYPTQSLIKTKELIPVLGINTCSCSNSFAAYYKDALLAIGGFPSNNILGEEVSVAARFIMQGKALAYSAEAQVYHSHDYTPLEEFRRYFDIGAFHNQQRAVLSNFSKAESEGFKYVLDEWKYLIKNNHIGLIPNQVLRTIAKYTGYRLGNWQNHLPTKLKRKLSMHQSFWQ